MSTVLTTEPLLAMLRDLYHGIAEGFSVNAWRILIDETMTCQIQQCTVAEARQVLAIVKRSKPTLMFEACLNNFYVWRVSCAKDNQKIVYCQNLVVTVPSQQRCLLIDSKKFWFLFLVLTKNQSFQTFAHWQVWSNFRLRSKIRETSSFCNSKKIWHRPYGQKGT